MAPISYYPIDGDEDLPTVQTTVRLRQDKHEDIVLMAELWTEMDEALQKPKRKTWRPSSVMERLVEVGVDGFWEQVGGRPNTKEGRKRFVEEAIQKLRAMHKK